MIKVFRKRFLVQENIQYLIYGQFVQRGGELNSKGKRSTTYKSMRTQDLKEVRENEIQSLDDTA